MAGAEAVLSAKIVDSTLESQAAPLLAALVTDQVASKLAAQDATLWGPEAEEEASIRLAWTALAKTSRPLIGEIEALREEFRVEGLDRIVLAGMGGSSLAPEVITGTEGVSLIVLDTTDPGQVAEALAGDLQRTVLVVSSKSGGTVETDSHRRIFAQAFTDAGIDAAQRIVVVTDPGSPFAELSKKEGYRRTFLAEPNVGGRYSALTAFGLVPSGLAGADIGQLLDQAASAVDTLVADNADNPALVLAAALGAAHAAGAEKVVLADTGSGIKGFGDWAEQLIAESTGKLGTGLLPVVVESTDAAGYADAKDDATSVAVGPVPDSGRSAVTTAIATAGTLGAQFLLWESAIAIVGRILGINPFDQPDVETAKKATRSLLDNPDKLSNDEKPSTVDGAIEVYPGAGVSGEGTVVEILQAFLDSAPEHGYLAIQAYLDRVDDASAILLRPELAKKTGKQTTFGWGPRFLHSTGQYHKGGHQNGIFLQITGITVLDLEVPDRPYTLGKLQHAQALGDGQVLSEHDRPVLRLHFTDRIAGLAQLMRIVQGELK